MSDNYIGDKFTSRDGYTCEIIERVTFDRSPSQCKYKIKFEDGFEIVRSYCVLRSGFSRYGNRTPKNYIGEEFISQDGFKCKIISDISKSGSPSCRHYLVRFEDGLERDYLYSTLNKGKFFRYAAVDFNHTFTSRDGYSCKIVKQATFDDVDSKCKFTVRFDDGFEKDLTLAVIKNQTFTKKTYGNYIGEKGKSIDGYDFEIVERLSFDKPPFDCRYLVRFEDGFEKEFNMRTIKQHGIVRYNYQDSSSIIGKEYTSDDGYKCKVTKLIEFRKSLPSSIFELTFEDGFKRQFSYRTFTFGTFHKFSSYTKQYIGSKYHSRDGFECTIVEQITNNSRKHCNNKFLVRFDDGFEKILTYSCIRKGQFLKHGRSDFPKIVQENIYGGFHLCYCKKCNMKNILTYHEIAEHHKFHIINR